MSIATGRWIQFCVVGIGGHARTKLIPAILANGQTLAGIVSRRPAADWPGAHRFATIEEAIAELTPDTVFILSTPPALHATQAKAALLATRDLLIEKPAFITAADAHGAVLACRPGAVLAEAFMHRYTSLFERLTSCWKSQRDDVQAVEIMFTLSVLPAGTFRSEAALASSVLYDVGCYAVSLFDDLDLPLDGLSITEVRSAGIPNEECVVLEGDLAGIRVRAEVGVATEYENQVTIRTAVETTRFQPFFYGRPGERRILREGLSEGRQSVIEGDAYRAMLQVPRSRWLESQPARLTGIQRVAKCQERLAAELMQWRARSAKNVPL
jgi:hypothetical protein